MNELSGSDNKQVQAVKFTFIDAKFTLRIKIDSMRC